MLAPRAQVDDGWLDFVHVAALTRWETLYLLPRTRYSGRRSPFRKFVRDAAGASSFTRRRR